MTTAAKRRDDRDLFTPKPAKVPATELVLSLRAALRNQVIRHHITRAKRNPIGICLQCNGWWDEHDEAVRITDEDHHPGCLAAPYQEK